MGINHSRTKRRKGKWERKMRTEGNMDRDGRANNGKRKNEDIWGLQYGRKEGSID